MNKLSVNLADQRFVCFHDPLHTALTLAACTKWKMNMLGNMLCAKWKPSSICSAAQDIGLLMVVNQMSL